MSKIVWKSGTMLYPLPAVLVTCGNMKKNNILTICWTGIINSDPAMTYISVRKERYSYNIIKESNEFVINLVPRDLVEALDYCGVVSGRNENKFKNMNLSIEKAINVEAPLLTQSPICLECKLENVMSLGTHDMFIAKILCVDVEEKYLDKDGKFNLEKCNLVSYSHGQYYSLGENLGKFGFSVEKKKK